MVTECTATVALTDRLAFGRGTGDETTPLVVATTFERLNICLPPSHTASGTTSGEASLEPQPRDAKITRLGTASLTYLRTILHVNAIMGLLGVTSPATRSSLGRHLTLPWVSHTALTEQVRNPLSKAKHLDPAGASHSPF